MNIVELCVDLTVDVSLVGSVVDENFPMNVLLNNFSIPSQHYDKFIINILYLESTMYFTWFMQIHLTQSAI